MPEAQSTTDTHTLDTIRKQHLRLTAARAAWDDAKEVTAKAKANYLLQLHQLEAAIDGQPALFPEPTQD